jgi:hypothetical protein
MTVQANCLSQLFRLPMHEASKSELAEWLASMNVSTSQGLATYAGLAADADQVFRAGKLHVKSYCKGKGLPAPKLTDSCEMSGLPEFHHPCDSTCCHEAKPM